MKNKKMDRRNFLIGSGFGIGVLAAQNPVVNLFNSMIKSVANQVTGQNEQFVEKALIHFFTYGGMPQYYGQLFLQPNNNDSVINNPFMFTKFNNGTKSYAKTLIDGWYMPAIWENTIPTSNGAWVPMADPAHHSLIARGVFINSNSHGEAQYISAGNQFGNPTVAGVLADHIGEKYSMPIVAVDTSNNRPTCNYPKSQKSYCTKTGPGNPINNLFDPFIVNDKSLLLDSDNARNLASEIVKSMGQFKDQDAKTRISQVSKNAIDLFMNSYDGFISQYNALRDKYENLIRLSIITRNMNGINASAINMQTNNLEYAIRTDNGNVSFSNVNDLRDIFNNNSSVGAMASSFAISEFLVINKFSCSVFNALGGISGISNDSHTHGAMVQWLGFSLYHRAHMACINELINVLKQNNLFDNTLIVSNTDFNRRPRVNNQGLGVGADHEGAASTIMLQNGKIEQLQLTGNIKVGTNSGNYPGTYGTAAPIQDIGHEIMLGNVITTMSNILDIKSTTNEISLVEKQGTKWVASFDPENI